ncbi:hypothetical protein Gotri_007218 [Gossypium trilobum]|uniref:DUF4283 domain-containing protein n=1 Tax=Gossypium trilobum TaxID=34281 RepID=A0A7J9EFX1_9ROSI|nr:hypothetical protein [Gossypium trilobum]
MEDSIASLSLNDVEEESIQLGVESSNSETSYANCFVGTFLTSSVVHFQTMRSTLANVRHPIGGVSILDLENGRFLFRFYFEVNVDQQGEDSLTVQLTKVDFWIIIHDLSRGFMSKVVVRQLGNFIGNFLEYDTSTIQLGYKGIIRLRGTVKVIDQSERLIRNRSISSSGNSMNNYGGSNTRESQSIPMNQ